MSNPAVYQLGDNCDPPNPPDEVVDEHPDEDWYQCDCGVWVLREEATWRMTDYDNCEDCDSSIYD